MSVRRKYDRIPDPMSRRLPAYYRMLQELEAAGQTDISSLELARMMNLTDSQIRHDLSSFGGFGRRGLGYNVSLLKKSIGDIMDINRKHRLIVIGAGNIGRAVAMYAGFREAGFEVEALFDVDPQRIGVAIGQAQVYSMEELEQYLKNNPVDIAVLATPVSQAQKVLDILGALGVTGVWNFVPATLNAPEGTIVFNVHLADSLMALSFRMHEKVVVEKNEGWTEA